MLHESVHDEVVQRIAKAYKQVRIGDPWDRKCYLPACRKECDLYSSTTFPKSVFVKSQWQLQSQSLCDRFKVIVVHQRFAGYAPEV